MDLHVKVLCSFMLLLFVSLCDASTLNKASQRLEVKRSNRIPLKSIKSPDGDIIDCIDIYQQPAFDHPLLQNHTIQMRPSYYPEGAFGDDHTHTEPIISQLWHKNGRCPEGTIPIRRTKKENIFTGKSIKNYRKESKRLPRLLSSFNPPIDKSNHEHSTAKVKGSKYYGAMATINVWQPQVMVPNEFSLSQIWVLGGSDDNDMNTIEAGWQVYSMIYGDNTTRFFIFWTKDGYKTTGCYNLHCPGFVQIYNGIVLGGSFSPISTYHGEQFDITIKTWKDRAKQVWWLQVQNVNIGYWPVSLFTHLADTASSIEWGGEIVNSRLNGQHTTTQMGSGHFAEEGYQGASYFKNLQIVDESDHFVPPNEKIKTVTEAQSCYNLKLGKNDESGNFFLYGGPGRNPNCP